MKLIIKIISHEKDQDIFDFLNSKNMTPYTRLFTSLFVLLLILFNIIFHILTMFYPSFWVMNLKVPPKIYGAYRQI